MRVTTTMPCSCIIILPIKLTETELLATALEAVVVISMDCICTTCTMRKLLRTSLLTTWVTMVTTTFTHTTTTQV